MKNTIIMFSLALVLLFVPITTYAAESNDSNDDIVSYEAETINQFIMDYGIKITAYAPYISKTFRPRTDRIEILFGGGGTFGTYTYYLEEQNANGTWSVINSHTVKPMGTISTSVYVTPRNAYRIRATTTDTKPSQGHLEVYELIFD